MCSEEHVSCLTGMDLPSLDIILPANALNSLLCEEEEFEQTPLQLSNVLKMKVTTIFPATTLHCLLCQLIVCER